MSFRQVRAPRDEPIITLPRVGFEWAPANSALSYYDTQVHADQVVWRDSIKALMRTGAAPWSGPRTWPEPRMRPWRPSRYHRSTRNIPFRRG